MGHGCTLTSIVPIARHLAIVVLVRKVGMQIVTLIEADHAWYTKLQVGLAAGPLTAARWSLNEGIKSGVTAPNQLILDYYL